MAETMYRQIAEELRYQIESGQLPPGSMLPTEIDLRERYSASRNTVRSALNWLSVRGLVESYAGRGTFVSQRPEPMVTLLSAAEETVGYASQPGYRRWTSTSTKVEIQRADGYVAQMLSLPEDAEVVRRQQDRFLDGRPWSVQTLVHSMELVTRGAERLIKTDEIEEGELSYLHTALGLAQLGYLDRIRVSPPESDESRLFKLPDNGRVSVINVIRTSFAEGQFPYQVKITSFPADRNELLILSGDVPPPEF
jgi:GntR family transcriptional regulator